MGPSGRTENCCHCCAQRGSCASPALLSALPWRTAPAQHLVFQMPLQHSFFFLFFSPPNASRALLADLHLEVKCLAPVGHAASEPFDPCPDRREHSEALLLPGSDLSFMRWRQGPRWLRALLAAGSEGVAVCFRSDQVPGPSAGRLLYKWPGGVNRLLYRSVLSPRGKVKCSVAFQLQWAPHPEGPAGFDGGC